MNDFRSGYIAIIGRPNVGKSTLVNALLGQKIAAVSPKPQTTRKRQLGILTTDKYQLVFVDTPGMHNPRHKLGKFLNQEAEGSLAGVDAVLWLVDSSVKPTDEDKQIGLLLGKLPRRTPLVLAANKMDALLQQSLPEPDRRLSSPSKEKPSNRTRQSDGFRKSSKRRPPATEESSAAVQHFEKI